MPVSWIPCHFISPYSVKMKEAGLFWQSALDSGSAALVIDFLRATATTKTATMSGFELAFAKKTEEFGRSKMPARGGNSSEFKGYDNRAANSSGHSLRRPTNFLGKYSHDLESSLFQLKKPTVALKRIYSAPG